MMTNIFRDKHILFVKWQAEVGSGHTLSDSFSTSKCTALLKVVNYACAMCSRAYICAFLAHDLHSSGSGCQHKTASITSSPRACYCCCRSIICWAPALCGILFALYQIQTPRSKPHVCFCFVTPFVTIIFSVNSKMNNSQNT